MNNRIAQRNAFFFQCLFIVGYYIQTCMKFDFFATHIPCLFFYFSYSMRKMLNNRKEGGVVNAI